MKTTLNISDVVMRRLKKESAQRGKTMSEIVEAALRLLFQKKSERTSPKLPPLPELDTGGARVNIANRETLYDVMGQ